MLRSRNMARSPTPYAGTNRIRFEGLPISGTLSALCAPLSYLSSLPPRKIGRCRRFITRDSGPNFAIVARPVRGLAGEPIFWV